MRIIYALFLLFVAPVYAAESAEQLVPLNEKLSYEASFLGLGIGKAGIEINQKPEAATVICDIATSGIVGLFVKHSSHTELTASGADFVYPQKNYASDYQTRGKKRSVKLVYSDGKITQEIIAPPESSDKRPKVPDIDKNAAYDLMSFLLQIRKELFVAKATGKTHFSIDAYDGRRLTNADFNITGTKTIKISGKKYVTTVVVARRTFKAGYSKSEMESYDPNEPSMTLYFSTDEKLIPLRFEIPFFTQTVTTNLVNQ